MDWKKERQEQRAGKAMDNGVKVNTAQMPVVSTQTTTQRQMGLFQVTERHSQ